MTLKYFLCGLRHATALELCFLCGPRRIYITGGGGLFIVQINTEEFRVRIFLIGIVEGGVQLGPLNTAATNRPIVPAPGDYDDGEIGGIIGRGNQSTWKKYLPKSCFVHHKPHILPEHEPWPPRVEASD
jgi:hypothetical protein